MDPLTRLQKDQDRTWARSGRREARDDFASGCWLGFLVGIIVGILTTLWFVAAHVNP